MERKPNTADVPALFKPGSAVEISPIDWDLRFSLFTGKVIRHLENNQVLIEYDNPTADESKSNQLTEVVYLFQLRPPPPKEIGREFKLGDEVDAYHKNRWMEGYMRKECGKGRFAVVLRALRRQIEIDKEELRLHREWHDDDYWVPPFEQKQEQQQEENLQHRLQNLLKLYAEREKLDSTEKHT